MESQFRHEHERAVEGRAEPFVLTHDQRLEILDAMEEARMWCSFRAFVSCWGLLQYLLAPAAMLCSVVTFGFGLAKSRSSVKGQRPIHPIVIGTSCVILSAACIVMMLYRGYFSSLG